MFGPFLLASVGEDKAKAKGKRMPKHIFDQPVVTLTGEDVSQFIDSCEFMVGRRPTVEVTGLSDTYEQHLTPNLRRWSVRLNYFQSYGSSSNDIYTVLKAVYDSTSNTGVSFSLKPSSAIQGPTNPTWSGDVAPDGDWSFAAGGVAEANRGSISFKGVSTLTIEASST